MMKTYSTSALAKRAGVGVHTLRYYLRRGLLRPSGHRPSGYGVFTDHDVRRLELIVAAKQQGLTLSEIKRLLELLEDPDTACPELVGFARDKIESLDRKIDELTAMKGRLQQAVDRCTATKNTQRCPSLVQLASAANNAVVPNRGD